MISRDICQKIKKLREKYPVISITGPRQSGKTTLARALFGDYEYLNLENIDLLQMAKEDPRSFIKSGRKKRIIIDEVQRYPDLLSYIQVEVDEQNIAGQFVVTGSQQFKLNEKMTQSLAGRVANFTLSPLTVRELSETEYKKHTHFKLMLKGFYPRLYDKKIDPKDYYRDYLFTYVERDVRQIKNIGDLSGFQKFLRLLAGRVGQLINMSSLASDTGVSYKTIDSWLSVLESSFIIFRLQPFYRNFGKRLIKSPKLYFYDTGLLCYLLGLDSVKELRSYYAVGSVFENLVIADVLKNGFNVRTSDQLYFWRDNHGDEVDLIVDRGGEQEGVEIKLSRTYSPDLMKALRYWANLSEEMNLSGTLLYAGDTEQKIGQFRVRNWRSYLCG